MWPDIINGAFEFGGAVALWQNVRAIRRDKRLQGVHWIPALFFAMWGIWGLFYYPHLDQWVSFTGGIALVSVNIIWLWFVAWYAWLARS